MENRTLTLRPRTKLGWGPIGPTGNRNRSSPRHFHRRGWGVPRDHRHQLPVSTPLRLSQWLREIKVACSEKLSEELFGVVGIVRSEEHTSELQSLMRISYAVFCLQKKIQS